MKLEQLKQAISAAYVIVVIGSAFALGVTSPAAWVAVTALAVLPAVALLALWSHPTESMSEAIRSARR